jgi:DNA integrity scanning protein DisA with diadenylate cyclase activity
MAETWKRKALHAAKTGEASQLTGSSSERLPSDDDLARICSGTDITQNVLKSVVQVAIEIAREGREGQAVGTSFVVGDTGTVLKHSRQFVLNPFHGHYPAERQIKDGGVLGNIKEFAQLDGAFIVTGDGIVEAAGRYITVETSQVDIPKGLGSRHSSIAGITLVANAIGIVVSQSGGLVTLFKGGKARCTIHP